MSKMHQYLCYALAGLFFVGFGVLVASRQFISQPELNAAQLLPNPKKILDINLESSSGNSIDATVFTGNWTLVFFGFTSCPDLCPMELQRLSKLLNMDSHRTDLKVFFVSVDPERDTAEKLKEYLKFFNQQILGIRGNNKEIADLARFLGAAYDRSFIVDNQLQTISAGMDMPSIAGEHYQVSHSLRIFIINERGEYIGSFAPPHDIEIINTDMKKLMR